MSDIRTTPMRDALAWATNDTAKAKEPTSNPFVWFWEAVEGDFNEDRSTAQVLVDAAISMIPLVDQLCDVRDLIANVKKLSRNYSDIWAWVALALTLIGLFPTLGSLIKGVLKIFFAYIRRTGGNATANAVDGAMTWIITFLRRREVQRYIRQHKVDEVFKWLASEIKAVRAKVNVGELTRAFDRVINVIQVLANKVQYVPLVGRKATAALKEVKNVRMMADKKLAEAVKPVQDIIDTLVLRLEKEAIAKQKGIVDVANVHYRGVLPEAAAVALMRKRKPSWLSKDGDEFFTSADPADYRDIVKQASAKVDSTGRRRPHKDRFPELTDQSIRSFHTLAKHKIVGPARLYRILAPNSRAMSDCWVTEAVFKKLQSSPDPKAAWRKYLGVWPDWNVNGQFVIYDVKAGETLNVWRGIASSQKKEALPGFFLQGGGEQIVFNLERKDARHDSVLYYKIKSGKENSLTQPLTQDQVNAITAKMNPQQKMSFFDSHLCVRENINHPNINGPFETGWGYNEFDGAGLSDRIGLPQLDGQTTIMNR